MSKPKPFNNPFGTLKLKTPEEPAPKTARGPPPPRARPRETTPLGEDEEARLFLESVGAVAPVRRVRAREPAPTPGTSAPRGPSEDEDVLAQLSELVSGDAPFALSRVGDSVAGQVAGLDARLLEQLRRGVYAVQAHLDLHGFTPRAEEAALEQFLVQSRQAKVRCVTVASDRPEALPALLSGGRTARQVLAFNPSTGMGTFSVLLRR